MVHVATLQGHLDGWREDDGWHVGTSGLRINDGDLGAMLRGGLSLQSDGSSPRVDVAVQLSRRDGRRLISEVAFKPPRAGR